MQKVENRIENVGDQQSRDVVPPDKEAMSPDEAGDTKEPSLYNDLDAFEKPRIVYIPSGIKVLVETPYIVIAEDIYIFAGNL